MEQIFDSQRYTGQFMLDRYRFVPDVGQQAITLETEWRGETRTERPYQIEVVATAFNSIDGEIVTEPDSWYPQNSNYLTTCWRAGDRVRDVHVIWLPTIAEPVEWTLRVQMLDPHTGHRIPAEPVQLGPIPYP